MSSVSVDLLSVIAAAIAGFTINVFWYSPTIFGNSWQRSLGKSFKTDIVTWQHYISVAVVNLIVAYVLAHFVSFATVSMGLAGNAVDSALIAAWIWFGFLATASFLSNRQKKFNLEVWVIEAGQLLVSLIIMSVIINGL